ncbi:MAG: hypothetical protein COC06_05215 [Bacteroidales bacterium]|nr:MAG: hypothetical protein COC06_05215 [Bacteroidales bacterium]
MKLFNFIKLAIFTGGVFLTSSNFVDPFNTPKYYFVLICLLLFVIAFSIREKQFKLFYHRSLLLGSFWFVSHKYVVAYYNMSTGSHQTIQALQLSVVSINLLVLQPFFQLVFQHLQAIQEQIKKLFDKI